MAVFTPVTFEQAQAHLRAYGLGALERLDPISQGVENTNYRARIAGADYVLTLYEKRVRAADLPFFLGLTTRLADADFPAPRPRVTVGGDTITTLNGRPSALIDWKPGAWRPEPDLHHHHAAGAALAQLHLLARDVPGPANRFSLDGWRLMLDACRTARPSENDVVEAFSAQNAHDMLAALEAQWAALARDWPQDLPGGVIHGDFFPDNILFTGDAITGVIDFYFACRDSWAYDLAIAINAWCFDAHGGFLQDAAAAFRDGYESVRSLTPAETAAFPALCRGAALRFTLSRLHDVLHHDPSWFVSPKDPRPFFRRLEHFTATAPVEASTAGLH